MIKVIGILLLMSLQPSGEITVVQMPKTYDTVKECSEEAVSLAERIETFSGSDSVLGVYCLEVKYVPPL